MTYEDTAGTIRHDCLRGGDGTERDTGDTGDTHPLRGALSPYPPIPAVLSPPRQVIAPKTKNQKQRA